MIPPTTTPPPAPAPATPPAQPTDYSFNTFAQQLEEFVRGVLNLDPQQALLRAGLSFLVLIGAVIIIWGLHIILKSLTERIAPKDDAAPKRGGNIGRWTMRVVRLTIFVVALIVILRLWGFDFATLRDSPLYAAFTIMGRIAIILVLALAGIELGQLAIRRVFERVATRARNPRRAAQIRTLGPVLSGLATTIVVIIAAMMALSEVGVEIGPLLAGAGIVGLAVGFGAQTIVKDFLTGLFLIMEDSVSIGDVVKIGEFSGTVEDMSLRTIKLRAYDGTLHIFPYSEAQVISNRTKLFSYAVFDLQLSFISDLEHALATFRATAESLAQDETFKPLILAPPEIAGVDAINDNAIMLKGRIRTRPGDQWRVQREFNKRIKHAFDAAGVLFAQRHLPIPPFDAIAGNADLIEQVAKNQKDEPKRP
ncbi:MAG: mechanosensitive ion channel [Hyphomonadaceae bacterium]|nr:mechanosensitive ion channel [Hyphomonadaceae bacterium]